MGTSIYEMNEIAVRAMQQADIQALLDNFAEQGWAKPREVLENYLDGQNDGSLWVFMADYHDAVAGYAVLYPDANVGPFAHMKLPLISDLIVFYKHQRHGVESAILDAAEKKAAELGDRVQLGVGLHSGYGAAQRLYIKRGYVPDGTGAWYRDSPLEPYADCRNDDDLVLFLVKDLHPLPESCAQGRQGSGSTRGGAGNHVSAGG